MVFVNMNETLFFVMYACVNVYVWVLRGPVAAPLPGPANFASDSLLIQNLYFLTWTDEETVRLIRLRAENDNLFTGKRHAAGKAWKEILRQMGLQGRVSHAQAAKKWDNLKRKYKELRSSAAGTGTDRGESTAATAATWPCFSAMHEAIGGGEPVDLLVPTDSRVAENPAHVADEASDAGGSSPLGSVTATHSQTCVKEEEEEEEEGEATQPFCHHSWTHFQTFRLIRLRSENDHRFTGKRHTAKKAWKEILQQMGLQGQVSPAQAAKKWDNMKRKYKELRSSASGTGTDRGEATAATWPWFTAMHEAVDRGESVDLAHVADETSDAGGSSPSGSVTATGSVVCVEVGEEVVEEEEETDDDDAQPDSSGTDDEPCTFACPPPPKRRRTCQAAILEFLKEEAAKEEERFRAAQETTNRFLDLFERLINKL
ncbi:uncharacterized protein LOC118216942 isoform X1 [Anguilla anguilla]|uniref:uncharacterized protein LOC118216942 isoform X1 n=1 Tax=Anguilla anguilla TaxID=7936 RepID=UPI0015B1FA6A|nr:uncharacterized protein LOC118216942 isoform X1 [Anguilla anguilla]